MFQEVKNRTPVSGDGYDAEIIGGIKAAVRDLTATADITLDGVVDIVREQQEVTETVNGQEVTKMVWVITDNSTIEDDLTITAIAAWVNMHLFNPPNYANLKETYESIKGSMGLSSEY